MRMSNISYQITRLSVIGGDDMKSTVANVMSAVLTPDVALELNWCGRGTKEKAAFGDLNLTTIIYSSYYHLFY
jgi:hypothetical protein